MFYEKKYQNCISHLVGLKVSIVIGCIILFSAFGLIIGIPIMQEITDEEITLAISAGIGAVIGIIVGVSSTWRVEKEIQESYWRVEILNELKKQNSVKNNPVAKTVVAIENKQSPKIEENKTEIKENSSENNEEK